MNGWHRVSKTNPCPICKRKDWDVISDDGRVAICMRVQSDMPSRNGGWIHYLDEPQPIVFHKDVEPPPFNANTYWKWLCGRQKGRYENEYQKLGEQLGGVPSSFIRSTCTCWEPERRAFAFPMMNGLHDKTIGIRLRWHDGAKGSIAGSRSGLVYDTRITNADTMYVVEGQTDYLIMRYLGYAVIGRQSCLGCEDMVDTMVKRWSCKRVVIVMDVDSPKDVNGMLRWPGRSGAIRLANALSVGVSFVVPSRKDIREVAMVDGLDKVKDEMEGV